MVQFSSRLKGSRRVKDLIDPLVDIAAFVRGLTCGVAGEFAVGEVRYVIPRFVFVGPRAEHEPIRLGLFAGLHGDEPAGSAALIKLLCDLSLQSESARGYELVVFPVCNPFGYEHGCRENHAGLDLNREFWRASDQPEVLVLEKELRAHRLDGIVSLHADDSSEGVYGYAHGQVLNEALLRPALEASASILPRNAATQIDGFEADDGVIHSCFEGVLSAPPEQQPRPFDLILETPALAPIDLQERAAVAALGTILDRYRRFMAYGQHL